MKHETIERINELIEELKVNDKKEASEYERRPKEPKEAMEELVKIGRPAVESILELLKNASRYSCLYAIKVLGEIGDPRCVRPIIDVYHKEEFDEAFEITADPLEAVVKVGPPALEPTLNYLKEAMGKDDDLGVFLVLPILGKIKHEKSFDALIEILSHSKDTNQQETVRMLGEYGDKRAVEHLKKLIENPSVKDQVVEAIRKLVPTQEYRGILEPYILKDLESFTHEINADLREIESAHRYPANFEGDNADEFRAIALEHVIQESVERLLDKTIELGVYESVIPDTLKEGLRYKLCKVRGKWQEFKHKHEEEISIIDGHFPEDVKSQMTKSYKGLAGPRWDSNPQLGELLTRIWDWLRKQGFLATKQFSHLLWARKGTQNKRKGCYIAVTKDDKRGRTWGIVHLALWGKGWTPKEIEKFSTSFWNFTEGTVTTMVDKRKLQIQIVKD